MARDMKDSGVEWIGEIPEGWDIIKLKYLFKIIGGNGFSEALQGNTTGDYPFCKVSDINGNNDYIDTATNWVSKSVANEHRFNIIPVGSIIIAKIGAALAKNHRKVNIVECCIDNNTQALVMKRNDNIRFLLYLCKCIDMSWFDNNSTVPSINNTKLLDFYVPDVSKPKQTQIASFLDTQCAQIDAVIEKTRASIVEYKKLKQAVITQAVTKGIRPGREMKDSGIEWVRMIPKEWETINPKALFSQRKDKALPGERQLTASQQYGVVYQDEYMELTGSKVVTVEKDFDILKHVEAGDFVISMRSFQGGLEYSTNTGSISSAYVMLIPNLESVFPRYYRWLLKSSVYINALQSTTNMVRDGQAMRYANFIKVRLFSVPLNEQEEIADYLDAKCSELDRLIHQKSLFLSELESYKKSLIFEYVTGKKEVP